jgi:hypothetical protein
MSLHDACPHAWIRNDRMPGFEMMITVFETQVRNILPFNGRFSEDWQSFSHCMTLQAGFG